MKLDELTARVYPQMTERGRLAWETFIQNSTLFQVIEFRLGATDDTYRTVEDNNTVGGRAEGDSYSGDLQTPNSLQSGTLMFMGYRIYVDESRRQDSRLGLKDFAQWLEDQIVENSWAFALKMEEYYFQGDGTGNIMTGLNNILDGSTPIPGFSSETGVISATNALSSGTEFDLENEDNWPTFVRFCRRIKKEVRGATHWEMNSDVAGIVSAIADDKRVLGNTETEYGTNIETFLGLPMVDVDNQALPNNEDNSDSSASDCTSMYLAANVEGRLHLRSNSGFYTKDIDELPDDEKMAFMNEIRAEHEIRDKRAIRRIQHLKVNDLAA